MTDQDVEIEALVIAPIRNAFPRHTILAEEAHSQISDSEFSWAIDPIDGTVNWVAGVPFSATTVCLYYRGIPVEGVIFDHGTRKLFHASRGEGAFADGQRISVSKNTALADCIVSLTMTSHYSWEDTKSIAKLLASLNMKARGVRIFVSQALELALVASGVLDAQVCPKPSRYDVGAGALLLREAGGRVTDLSGEPYTMNAKEVVGSNGRVHDELLRVLQRSEAYE